MTEINVNHYSFTRFYVSTCLTVMQCLSRIKNEACFHVIYAACWRVKRPEILGKSSSQKLQSGAWCVWSAQTRRSLFLGRLLVWSIQDPIAAQGLYENQEP